VQTPRDRPEAIETLATAQAKHMIRRTMEEILWNDPRDFMRNNEDFELSRRGIGKHFGLSVSSTWLKILDAKVILRGHEPCEGYKIDHRGLVFTIFTCKESYPKAKAAYLDIVSKDMVLLRDGYDLRRHMNYV
jgi:protein phosphatase